jgi:hypothetical protein
MFPNLIRLWNFARDRIEEAKYLIVVGFSFSDADSYINKIIERSMSFHPGQTIIICDPNPRLAQSLKERFAARINGFDVTRVLAAVGPAEEMVPKVLVSIAPPHDAVAEAKQEKPDGQIPRNRRKRASVTSDSSQSGETLP